MGDDGELRGDGEKTEPVARGRSWICIGERVPELNPPLTHEICNRGGESVVPELSAADHCLK